MAHGRLSICRCLDVGRGVHTGGLGLVWLPDSLTAADIADVLPTLQTTTNPVVESRNRSTATCRRRRLTTLIRRPTNATSTQRRRPRITSPAVLRSAEAREHAESVPRLTGRYRLRPRCGMTHRGVSDYERVVGATSTYFTRFARTRGPQQRAQESHRSRSTPGYDRRIAMAVTMGKLSDDDLQRLNAIPGWEAAAEDAASRVIGFDLLRRRAQEQND